MNAAGVYVHLPFCPYICPYCDFAKWPHKESAARRYLQALHAEIDRAGSAQTVGSTVFLGGGTPNTYQPGDLAELLDHLNSVFPGPSDRETTIEVNPELVRAQDFEAYLAAGVNRISIGVQSFEPAEVRTLGRRHGVHDVERAVRAGRSAGIRSVSVDLMFAVPGQTRESWLRSLRAAVALGVDHVSAYGLTIEPGTPFERLRRRQPETFFDDVREAELYELAIATLEQAGLTQYEISNFARSGHRSAHNENYWANGDYVGLGVGAASYRDGVRSVHTKELGSYVDAVLAGLPIPGQAERLEGCARTGEAVMLALRTRQGVSLQRFKERYGVDFLERYATIVDRYRGDGLLEVDATHVRLTMHGRFMANDVCAAFVTLE